jgi:hypothetical protein
MPGRNGHIASPAEEFRLSAFLEHQLAFIAIR